MNIKHTEIERALKIQVLDQSVEVNLLGSPARRNSWTFKIKNKEGETNVVKVIKPNSRNNQEAQCEEDALERLKQNKKVSVVYYEEKGTLVVRNHELYYFIFPYIDGMDLGKVIAKEGVFGEKRVLKIIESLFTTILQVANEGVIHQDIKPGNIILNEDDEAILLDFGIARFIEYDHRLVKQQGPAVYLSPEQISVGLEKTPENQRRVTFLSDVYSACVVGLNLLLGKNFLDFWKPDQRADVVNKINVNEGIEIKDKQLKEILINGLQTFPSDRLAVLEIPSTQKIGFIRGRKPSIAAFWNLHHWNTGTEILINFAKENNNVKGGVLFQSEHIRSVENDIKKSKDLQAMGWRVAVDPSTYKLPFLNDHYARLTERSYFRSGIVPAYFYKPQFTEQFVKNVLEFQKVFNPDLYISPYFYVDDTSNNYLDINFSLFEETKNQLTDSSKPLLFGLAISERIVKNHEKLSKLIDQLIFYPNTNAYYLRVELTKPSTQPVSDRDFLYGLNDLVNKLSRYNSVLLSQLDQSVLGLFANTKISVALNPEASMRKNDIEDKYTTEKSTGGPKKKDKRTWVYIPELLNDLDLHRDLRRKVFADLDGIQKAGCRCKYCKASQKGIDPLEKSSNRLSHFLFRFHQQVADITKSGNRVKVFEEMLDKAEKLYGEIDKGGVQLDGENNGRFLRIWREVFVKS